MNHACIIFQLSRLSNGLQLLTNTQRLINITITCSFKKCKNKTNRKSFPNPMGRRGYKGAAGWAPLLPPPSPRSSEGGARGPLFG